MQHFEKRILINII